MKLFTKILNVLCLILWSIQLMIAIVYAAAGTPVNPVLYLLAVIVLILHYMEALLVEG